MSDRIITAIAPLVVVCAALIMPGPSQAQAWVTDSACPEDDHATFHACAKIAAKDAEPPRMDNGRPDFNGIWRRRAAAHESIHAHPRTLDDFGGPSLVVDPPNGLVPIQNWAEAQRRYNRNAYVHHNAICRLDGVPLTMYMTSRLQFMLSPDYFLVQGEEAHAFRMIPVDGRENIDDAVKLWNGDSVGRWDGDSLEIETTNQNARAWLDQRGRFFTDEAHVVERITLIDANTIHYQATVTDENVYTAPFTLAFAFRRSTAESDELLEEACYEDNALAEQQFKNVGYKVYPGITGTEARRLRAAWEIEEAGE